MPNSWTLLLKEDADALLGLPYTVRAVITADHSNATTFDTLQSYMIRTRARDLTQVDFDRRTL